MLKSALHFSSDVIPARHPRRNRAGGTICPQARPAGGEPLCGSRGGCRAARKLSFRGKEAKPLCAPPKAEHGAGEAGGKKISEHKRRMDK